MATDGRDDPLDTGLDAMAEPKTFATGRFVVRKLLGRGGQKTVYLAHDLHLDRDVAISVLNTEGMDEASVARAQLEATTLARLGAQPHIVTVFDIGTEIGASGAAAPYLVCEYMAGGDLREMLRHAGGQVPIEQAIAVVQDVCSALQVAHAHGVLHRDIKPANIWLAEDGKAKLGDFGLALAEGRSRLTQSGAMLGTAAYMSPEQAVGGEIDARSDLYSLGCVLYELVTGRPPFLGDDIVAVVSQHVSNAPVAPSWYNQTIPKELERLVLALLAKTGRERPASASEVLDALRAISTARDAPATEQANPLDRLAGGVFVGREGERAQLRSVMDEAVSGRGRLVLLAGEPGIGKTRLAEELTTYANMRGAQVLWGRCYEGEGAPAYWPWLQAFRTYVRARDTDTLRAEMGSGAGDIAQLVSEVRERLPELADPPALEPEQARFRLFDSVATFFKAASRSQPLALILDDLHWADRSSLLLLQFAARELLDSRILLLGSYRDAELGRQHPLSHALAELAREQLSLRISLHGLGEEDVETFIQMTAGIEPPDGLVRAVYQKTEGNPFFVKEIVSLLASERQLVDAPTGGAWTVAIPQSVREVIGRRLDRLSAECDRVLTIASVIGREFGLDVLARVTSLPSDILLDLLEAALRARVIEEVPEAVGRYSFAHALIRETLYDDLTTIRRVRLHRQIGEALETVHAAKLESHLAELAFHFGEAARNGHDVDKAIDYAQRAATSARSQYAYEEAADLYNMALKAAERQEHVDGGHYCEILLSLAEAQSSAGHVDVANETFLRAAQMARDVNLPGRLARAALGFGSESGEAGSDSRLISLLEEALSVVDKGDSTLRARLMGRLAAALYYAGSQERRSSLSQQAVDMARRAGDSSTLAYVLTARRYSLWGPENAEERLAIARDIVRLADQIGDRELALRGYQNLATDLLELGDSKAMSEAIAAHARLSAEVRQPIFQAVTAVLKATKAQLEGRFDEAERLAEEMLALARRAQSRTAFMTYAIQVFAIRRDQGRLDELEGAVKGFVEQFPAVRWTIALAYLHSELDRFDEARKEFDQIAANDFTDIARDMVWLIGLTLLAQTCAYLADAQRAARLYELLVPYAGRCVVVGACDSSNGAVSRFLGLLATTMTHWEQAERHFENALEMNARMGARPFVAHTQYDYANMLFARGNPVDRARALELLASALATAQELGMQRLIERASALILTETPARMQGGPA